MIECKGDTLNIEGTQEEILAEFFVISKNIVGKVLSTELGSNRKERAKLLFDVIIDVIDEPATEISS